MKFLQFCGGKREYGCHVLHVLEPSLHHRCHLHPVGVVLGGIVKSKKRYGTHLCTKTAQRNLPASTGAAEKVRQKAWDDPGIYLLVKSPIRSVGKRGWKKKGSW